MCTQGYSNNRITFFKTFSRLHFRLQIIILSEKILMNVLELYELKDSYNF